MNRSTCLLLFAWLAFGPIAPSAAEEDPDAASFSIARRLGRGVNMGNALEAPREGEWGMELKEEYFQAIAKAGFQSVRIPIRWSAHAKVEEPYTIDATFFERVDWGIEQALKNGLMVVINVHHYNELDAYPAKHGDRLVAFWKQISARYRRQSDSVVFEIYNEPHDKLVDHWNDLFPKALAAIRATNPTRTVIVGPTHWNRIDDLPLLKLPESDRHILVTIHYYEPFKFTHQDAPWVNGSKPWRGTRWAGTQLEKQVVTETFTKAAEWGKKNRRPLYLGEFGAFEAADMSSRATWTNHVAREAERLGIAWSYWEFGSGFGAYNRAAREWREPLREALVPKTK